MALYFTLPSFEIRIFVSGESRSDASSESSRREKPAIIRQRDRCLFPSSFLFLSLSLSSLFLCLPVFRFSRFPPFRPLKEEKEFFPCFLPGKRVHTRTQALWILHDCWIWGNASLRLFLVEIAGTRAEVTNSSKRMRKLALETLS